MWYQLNIGLNIPSGNNSPKAIAARRAKAESQFPRARFVDAGYVSPNGVEVSEPTIVVQAYFDTDMARTWATLVADYYKQDCIAVWCEDTEQGELIGPRAGAWGEFNPEYFVFF